MCTGLFRSGSVGLLSLALAWGAVMSGGAPVAVAQENGTLRIIAFGAHPDDCEIKAGGAAAMWAAQGHKVKFVSLTNGDIGHWREAGGPLARRRVAEVQAAATTLGLAETQVLDIHDGELMPTLDNRKTVVRLIREWKADIVLMHRPNDYHPDHRYTGLLVQDAAFMVIAPFFCPDVPHLARNPVFLYLSDNFTKPAPLQPDMVISIDGVIEKKLDALLSLESQMIEGCVFGHEDLVPKNAQERATRRKEVRTGLEKRFAAIADKYRARLIELYGDEQGNKVRYAEAFEVCEYGTQPSPAELRRVFTAGAGKARP